MGEPVPASVDEEWAHVSNAEGYAWLLPADEHTHDDVPPCPEEVGTVLPPADDDAHGVPPWIREAEASLQSPNVYSSDEPGGHREKTSPPLQTQHAHKPGSRLPASLVIVAMMALLVGGLELHMLSRVSAVGDACSGLVDSVRLECGSVNASSFTEGKQTPTSLWRAMIRQVAEARGEAEEARKALHEKTASPREVDDGVMADVCGTSLSRLYRTPCGRLSPGSSRNSRTPSASCCPTRSDIGRRWPRSKSCGLRSSRLRASGSRCR